MNLEFISECERILLDEDHSLCIYFPIRTDNTSPRSKVAVFNTTEEILEDYPMLEPLLTPLTNTNGAIFIIDPSTEQSVNLYVVYGNDLVYKNFMFYESISIYEKYVDEVKVIPFAVDLSINRFLKLINGWTPKEFLDFIFENFISSETKLSNLNVNELKF